MATPDYLKSLQNAYGALQNARASEGLKRDMYARQEKLYDATTYEWIITAMSHIDELLVDQSYDLTHLS